MADSEQGDSSRLVLTQTEFAADPAATDNLKLVSAATHVTY